MVHYYPSRWRAIRLFIYNYPAWRRWWRTITRRTYTDVYIHPYLGICLVNQGSSGKHYCC
jgi:hypothetical protein